VEARVEQGFFESKCLLVGSVDGEPTRTGPEVIEWDPQAEGPPGEHSVKIDLETIGHRDCCRFSDRLGVPDDRFGIDDPATGSTQSGDCRWEFLAANEKVEIPGGSHDSIRVVERTECGSLQDPNVDARVGEMFGDLDHP
jgi:hypothetical protein